MQPPEDRHCQLDHVVETRVVPAILDAVAGMPYRCPVSTEDTPDLGVIDAADDVRQVHRDLPRQRHLGVTARGSVEFIFVDAEILDHDGQDELHAEGGAMAALSPASGRFPRLVVAREAGAVDDFVDLNVTHATPVRYCSGHSAILASNDRNENLSRTDFRH